MNIEASRYLTLRRRQMLIIVGVCVSILVLAAAAFVVNDYISVRQSVRENLESKSAFIVANSIAAIQYKDERAAQEILGVMKNDKTVLLAALYTKEKKLFSIYVKSGQRSILPDRFPVYGIVFENSSAALLQPIHYQDEIQGWLYVVQDMSVIEEKIQRYIGIVLVIFIIGLLLSWVMSSISQKFITEPILQLVNFMGRIAETKNYSERIFVARDDEIGTLMNGFNNMLSTIQEGEKELKLHGERLESLVELRTKQLHHRANYDALTQLPNRYLLMEKINQAMESARRTDRFMALLLIDLDRFKVINDSLGHHVGDELLRSIATRLSDLSRIDDCVGRLGGDEFVILLGNITQPEDASLVARKIMSELSIPFELEQHRLHMSASIGISVFPSDADDAVGLLKRADISMYRSKAEGRGGYNFYDSDEDHTDQRLLLENKLRNAIKNNELYMVYQPQVHFQNGQICGVEALMRWYNPELGDISPAVFVPLAEEIGYINELTKWAIKKATEQHKTWHRLGVKPVRIAVNVSASDLLMPGFVDYVSGLLAEAHMPPTLLELEITEAVFLDRTEQIVAALRRLKASGVAIAIDDFGTGYSSLSYLQSFPVDTLKLDGSFIGNIYDSQKSRGIVSATISLAHSLGLSIVAECVESDYQNNFLTSERCDILQGYYFSEPLMGDALAVLLNSYTHNSSITQLPN